MPTHRWGRRSERISRTVDLTKDYYIQALELLDLTQPRTSRLINTLPCMDAGQNRVRQKQLRWRAARGLETDERM
jgi:hypothetical protein